MFWRRGSGPSDNYITSRQTRGHSPRASPAKVQLLAGGESAICPVCDAPLQPGAQRCPACNTELSLFDLDQDGTLDVDRIKVKSKEEIDAFLESLGDDQAGDRLKEIASVTEFGAPGTGTVTFECPACGADVEAIASECPSCGSTFAPGGEAGCPQCGANLPLDAAACPSCGTEFAPGAPRPSRRPGGPNLRPLLQQAREARAAAATSPVITDKKALYRELPKLVSEVKPMLLVGKDLGIDLAAPRGLINDAIARGKSREIEEAVRLVQEAKRTLHAAFTDAVARLLEIPIASLAAGDTGSATREVEAAVREALTLLRDGDYPGSHARAQGVVKNFPATATRGSSRSAASLALSGSEALLQDCEFLDIVDASANAYHADAQKAFKENRNDEAARLAAKAREAIGRNLPRLLDEEMRSARDRLLSLRERGGDITRGIGLLKEASLNLRRKAFGAAARDLRLFREDLRSRGGNEPRPGAKRTEGPRKGGSGPGPKG